MHINEPQQIQKRGREEGEREERESIVYVLHDIEL